MAAVSLKNLSKFYPNGVAALRDLSLEVADGEFLVLVGPSGSGKTTTLRLLAGLEAPSAGTMSIGGRPVDHLPARARDVALVFQRHTLYPHLTVRCNLSFGMDLRRPGGGAPFGLLRRWWPSAAVAAWERLTAERVAEAAEFLQLADLLDRRPDQLSGGQQQRVALGRALVRRAAVVLLDEPLSHLDTPLRSALRRQLHLLHKRFPATMIHVTHDPAEALLLADRVVVLDRGVAQQVDRPLTIYQQPSNRFVAGFFGWPSMNLLDGILQPVQDGVRLVQPDGVFHLRGTQPSAWQPHAGQAVTVGVRPHALTVTEALEPGSQGMTISRVEPLGDATLVTLQRGALELTAQFAGPAGLRAGQTVAVSCDLARTHLFEQTTGRALVHAGFDG